MGEEKNTARHCSLEVFSMCEFSQIKTSIKNLPIGTKILDTLIQIRPTIAIPVGKLIEKLKNFAQNFSFFYFALKITHFFYYTR